MGIWDFFNQMDQQCGIRNSKAPKALKFTHILKDLTGSQHHATLPANIRPPELYAVPIKTTPWPPQSDSDQACQQSLVLIPDPLETMEDIPSGFCRVEVEVKQHAPSLPAGFFPLEFFYMLQRIVTQAEPGTQIHFVSDDSTVPCPLKEEERKSRIEASRKKPKLERWVEVPDYSNVTHVFDQEIVLDGNRIRHGLLLPEGVHRSANMRRLLYKYVNSKFREARIPPGVTVTTILEGEPVWHMEYNKEPVQLPDRARHAEADTLLTELVAEIPSSEACVRVDSVDSDVAALLAYVLCHRPFTFTAYLNRCSEQGWADINRIRTWIQSYGVHPNAFLAVCAMAGCDFVKKDLFTKGLGVQFVFATLPTYHGLFKEFDFANREHVDLLVAAAACLKYGQSLNQLGSMEGLLDWLTKAGRVPAACVTTKPTPESYARLEAFGRYWISDELKKRLLVVPATH